jgi:hypothetical protein
LNDPVFIAPDSSSNQPETQTLMGHDNLSPSPVVFRALLQSLKINDYSLFDGQDE